MNGTAKITINPSDFSPEAYLHQWVEEHFSANQDEICQCYRDYFGAFEKNSRGVAICNDGLMIHRCNKALKKILDGDRNGAEKDKKANTFMEALSDMFPDSHDTADLIRMIRRI